MKRNLRISNYYIRSYYTFIFTILFVNIIFPQEISINELKIGDQIWMAENLNLVQFCNGDPIPEVKSKNEWEKAGEEGFPAWCYYENKIDNGKKYGKLYNWHAIHDKRGLAPKGWHIPTKEEFDTLKSALIHVGNKLNVSRERPENETEIGTLLFNSLNAGYRHYNGNFYFDGNDTPFWSTNIFGVIYANSKHLFTTGSYFDMRTYDKGFGFSVRCIKD